MPNEDCVRLEHIDHRRRVADLCGRVARSLSVEALTQFALALAASTHRDIPSGKQKACIEPLSENSGGNDSSFESAVVEMAEAILHRSRSAGGRRHRDLDLAGQIFEACDEFDQAVEFAAYDGQSISAAIDGFFNDADRRQKSRIFRTLRQITSPLTKLSLAGELPVLPAAAAKLMRTSVEDVSAFELESIAASDPVLAGRLLGVSNSAFFGPASGIRHLRQAILRLGVPFARKVLLEACFGPIFASGTLAELWKHSRLVAANAHELAVECGFDSEVAYVAGLLHDIGRLVMLGCSQEIRADEANRLAAGFPLVYVETLIYGTDHATVGRELLSRWSLSSEIVEAVAFHHCPERTDSTLAAILFLADDDSLSGASASENLSPGMRRARAIQIMGINGFSLDRINRDSAIFSLAS